MKLPEKSRQNQISALRGFIKFLETPSTTDNPIPEKKRRFAERQLANTMKSLGVDTIEQAKELVRKQAEEIERQKEKANAQANANQ